MSQHKDSTNISDVLASLWHYVEYPYEYWHYTQDLKSKILINESNALINQDINFNGSVTSNFIGRKRIADIINEINCEESDDEYFDRMETITNRVGLNQMFEERRQEREEKEKIISHRIASITSEEIDIEVQKIWSNQDESSSRKRMSKKDRDQATKNIIKRI
ncbi:unnamed protein product [Brachionus calyciflorus]|uniref:Uncharacterized protein n=1 Tax=Brachionus calyciflorus TaxID=104777 RepID=A0A814MUH1_9BILA|nr:unnamed protein product [Brachionus calyciflorus]